MATNDTPKEALFQADRLIGGYYCNGCSLSNTLQFRRDCDFFAYVVYFKEN